MITMQDLVSADPSEEAEKAIEEALMASIEEQNKLLEEAEKTDD